MLMVIIVLIAIHEKGGLHTNKSTELSGVSDAAAAADADDDDDHEDDGQCQLPTICHRVTNR